MSSELLTYKNIDRRTRMNVMAGLMLAMLVACFDGTIVGTIAPKICETLSHSDLYAWLVTAYLLCEAVMIPVSAKLSDLYGRKALYIIGLSIFFAGSVFAGLSQSMYMLIVCRAVQGIGGGIIIPVATASVGDLYEPEHRAKMQGMLGAIFGIGSGLGPIIGGYLAQYVTVGSIDGWRFCFYLNIPIIILSFALSLRRFPVPELKSRPVIDYAGIVVVAALLADVLLLIQMGGTYFDWFGPVTLVMVVLAVVLMVVFVMMEKRAVEPILSPALMHNRTVVVGCIYMFLYGVGMMGAMTYTTYFSMSFLTGMDTMKAGLYSMAIVVGMCLTSGASGSMVHKTGYKPWLVGGPIITSIALFMLSNMDMDVSPTYFCISLFVLGFGLGCMMSIVLSAVQNSCPQNEMGMSTGAVNLFRAIGCTIGTAVFSALITVKLGQNMVGLPPGIPRSTAFLDHLMDYPMYIPQLFQCFCEALCFAFLGGACIVAVLVVVGLVFRPHENREE
ncbi:MAG: MFS transporter [archaeon]|nr:MFS transporter [archaeon]